MARIEVVVIGASAGGLQALTDIVTHLPPETRATILVVVHTMAGGTNALPQILSRSSVVPIAFAADGAKLAPGRVYVAPPDLHLRVHRGVMRLTHGPKENGFRPAIDPLFRSAARAYRSAAMGVILSGALDDGTYGLEVIKALGGTAVVQDPNEAAQPSMILSAIRDVAVDYVLPARNIATLIAESCSTAGGTATMADDPDPDPQNPAEETDVEDMNEGFGPPSGLTCPDCGGALWEARNGAVTRYRCHVGHQYTGEALEGRHAERVEAALWTAVRVLEEHADLRKRMGERAHAAGMRRAADALASSAHDSHQQARTIRELLFAAAPAAPRPVRRAKKKTKKAAKTRRRKR